MGSTCSQPETLHHLQNHNSCHRDPKWPTGFLSLDCWAFCYLLLYEIFDSSTPSMRKLDYGVEKTNWQKKSCD